MSLTRYSHFYLLFIIAACFCSVAFQRKTSLYDSSKSNTLLLTRENFDKQITKHRGKLVSVIHYYKHDDDGSKDLTYEFEKFASEWQGAFRIGTVDCYEQYELCEKEQITKTPAVRVYPLLPIPAFDFEGEMSTKGWTASASRFVGSNVLELNSTTFSKFLQDNPSVPKALLFTDKAGTPLIWKSLSIAFEKKIFLGIVRQEQEDIFRQYGVKKTPQILIIKPTDKKTVVYDGELKYGKIFDFLNIYTETFVPGGENLANDKPWNREIFPELHAKSASDVCLSHEGYLCGIYLTRQAPDAETTQIVEQLSKDTTEGRYKYMWLNVESQPQFAQAFVVEEYPKFVILSHGKIKKYMIHEDEFTKNSIDQSKEKISSGDARFKRIAGDLPSLN